MTTTHTRKRMERLYSKLRQRIKTVVVSFKRQYGGNFDDLMAEANLYFIEIVLSYGENDKQKGLKLETKVRKGVWWRLLETKKTWARRNKILHQTDMPFAVADPKPTGFDLLDFLVSLSDSAKFVVQCVVHPPVELQRALDYYEHKKGKTTSCGIRISLKLYLATVGWSPTKITTVFREVRVSLSTFSEEK